MILLRILLFLFKQSLQRMNQLFNVNGLGQEAIHTALGGGLTIFVECVGGHGENRNIRQCGVVQRADASGGIEDHP